MDFMGHFTRYYLYYMKRKDLGQLSVVLSMLLARVWLYEACIATAVGAASLETRHIIAHFCCRYERKLRNSCSGPPRVPSGGSRWTKYDLFLEFCIRQVATMPVTWYSGTHRSALIQSMLERRWQGVQSHTIRYLLLAWQHLNLMWSISINPSAAPVKQQHGNERCGGAHTAVELRSPYSGQWMSGEVRSTVLADPGPP